jgi:hypothetical protein
MRFKSLVFLALLAAFSFGGTFTCRGSSHEQSHGVQRK